MEDKNQGNSFSSHDPGTGKIVWEGKEAAEDDVDQAVTSAKQAFKTWATFTLEKRISFLQKFEGLLKSHKEDLAQTISLEMGKPKWESLTEVDAMIGKISISIEAFKNRTSPLEKNLSGAKSITRFKPHGVVAVFGPFNFPGHLANGHIVPALLAGNTVVFKPSELTPSVAQKTAELWEKTDLPDGVFNLLQGGKSTGMSISRHPGLDGLFFTGSSQTGLSLHRLFAEHPEKILALEMGGNNPLIVWNVSDLKAAAYTTIQSAYLTSGQRCTCARRLILPKNSQGEKFLEILMQMISKMKVGYFLDTPEPFMGPVVSKEAAKHILLSYNNLLEFGANPLVEMTLLKKGMAFLSPGLIDSTGIKKQDDCEIFGPLLQVFWVKDFEEALEEANNTRYGLSAGILSDHKKDFEKFYTQIRAGIVNWNRPITGAVGSAPFGGVGLSGNHRPSAYFAADYCSYPVATTEDEHLQMPEKILPGIEM